MKTILRLSVLLCCALFGTGLYAQHPAYALYAQEVLSISVSKDRTNHLQKSATIKEIVLPIGRTACGKVRKIGKDILLFYTAERAPTFNSVFFNSYKSIFLADIASDIGLSVLFRVLLC
jgi:hypothetical protein